MSTNRLVEKEKVKTYASALLQGAVAQGGIAQAMSVRDQMDQIVAIMRENATLAETLKRPGYTPEERNALVKGTFAGVDATLVEVMAVMAERGDIDLLSQVANSFEEAIQVEFNVTIVDVTTAVELDDNLREIISQKTAKDLGTDVYLREHVDTSILGGIVMSANGNQIDASVTSRLEVARNVLKVSVDGGEC